MVAVWVMDDVTVSVPLIVTVYVPFAAAGVFTGVGDELELPPPPPQPDIEMLIKTRTEAAPMTANPRQRRLASQNPSSPVIARLSCIA